MTQPRDYRIALSGGSWITVREYGERNGTEPILFASALGVPTGYYDPFFRAWARSGAHVLGVETRGMPLSSVRDVRHETFGYGELVRSDLPAVIAQLRLDRYRSVGHSLGGFLQILAAAGGDTAPSSIVTIGSGSSLARIQSTPWLRLKRHAQISTIRAVTATLGYFPGDKLGFGGRQPAQVMRDWAYEARHGRYHFGGEDREAEADLPSLTTPTRVLALAGDKLMPEPAVRFLADRLPESVREFRLVHDPHGQPLDHIRWARKNPQPILDALSAPPTAA